MCLRFIIFLMMPQGRGRRTTPNLHLWCLLAVNIKPPQCFKETKCWKLAFYWATATTQPADSGLWMGKHIIHEAHHKLHKTQASRIVSAQGAQGHDAAMFFLTLVEQNMGLLCRNWISSSRRPARATVTELTVFTWGGTRGGCYLCDKVLS